jgi:hypothetical protein
MTRYRVKVETYVAVDAPNANAAKAIAEVEIRAALDQYGPTPNKPFQLPRIHGPFALQAVGKVAKVTAENG